MPSPSTRRGFLTAAVGAAALVAGCNERSGPSNQRGTVTPVDVPRTDEELLGEALAIDSPDVPSVIIVSESHHKAAISHVESVRTAAEAELSEADIDSEDNDVVRYGTPASILEDTTRRLQEVRESGPTRKAIRIASDALREVSRLLGVLRAENGTADHETLQQELEDEQAAITTLSEEFDYRIAKPLERYLPTLYAAESKLQEARNQGEQAEKRELGEEAEEPTPPRRIGELQIRLESLRRQRIDAEQFHSTATDPNAPSRRSRIDAALTRLATDIEPIAEEYGSRPSEQSRQSTDARLRGIRQSIGARSQQWTGRLDTHREDGRRVTALIDATDWLLLFESVDVAVERTVERLDSDEFPTEVVITEKRRGVEGIEKIAEATSLQRRFAKHARGLLRSGDRRAEQSTQTGEGIPMAHFLYIAAAECANRAMDRGKAVAKSLGG